MRKRCQVDTFCFLKQFGLKKLSFTLHLIFFQLLSKSHVNVIHQIQAFRQKVAVSNLEISLFATI